MSLPSDPQWVRIPSAFIDPESLSANHSHASCLSSQTIQTPIRLNLTHSNAIGLKPSTNASSLDYRANYGHGQFKMYYLMDTLRFISSNAKTTLHEKAMG